MVGLGVLAAFVIVMIIIGMSTPDTPAGNGQDSTPRPVSATSTTPNNTAKPSPGTTTAATPITSAATTPAANTPDLNSAQALDELYDAAAIVYCASGADDYLRSVAKYDFKWEDTGWLDTKFDKYLKQVESPGILVMISDKAELQNGFGAYQRVELRCSYDTQAKKVLSYSIQNDDN